jgi:hypothetical protein
MMQIQSADNMQTSLRRITEQAKMGYHLIEPDCEVSAFEEPCAVIPLAGICAGAAGQLAVLPRYSSTLARWTSRDPIGEKGGENLYRFLKNAINHIDVLGLFGPGDGIPDDWGRKYPGHGDFSNITPCPFDFNLEDTDPKTQPFPRDIIDLILGNWDPSLHFRDLDKSENDVNKAMSECNADAFQRAMHRFQDYFVHKGKGYDWDPSWFWWDGEWGIP